MWVSDYSAALAMNVLATPPPSVDMHKKAARGSLWAMAGFAAGHGLRLGSNLLLTRMVAQEAFGIMLIVNVVLLGIEQFADVGIGPGIIQSRRDDDRFLNTAWTIQVVRGVILTAVALAFAYPMAVFYEQPILLPLIAFAGCSSLFGGVRSTKTFTANRELAIGRLTLVDFLSRTTGTVVTLIWAFLSPTVWALAGGGLAFASIHALLSHVALPGIRNRFTWDREAARQLFGFGKWVFFSTLLGFVASQSDRILFGKLVDFKTLGVYSVASLIAMTPQQVIRHLTLSVNFPLYSDTVRTGGDLPTTFRQARRRVLALGGVLCSLLMAGGPVAVDLLWDDSYLAAGWMVQFLALATWFNTLEVTVEAALLARGESRRVAVASAGKIVAMLVFIPVGYHYAAFPGAIAGFAVSEIVRYLGIGILARPAQLRSTRQALGFTVMTLAASVVGFSAAHVGAVILNLPVLITAVVVGIVVGGLWLPVLAPMLRRGARTMKA